MKAGLFVAAAALTQLALAQPHHRHQHLHEKKDVVVEVDVVTATAPDAVVFVNQYGEPISTSFVSQEAAAATTAASVEAATTSAAAVAEATSEAEATSATAAAETSSAVASVAVAAKVSKTSSSSSTSAAATSSSSSSSSSYGLTYSPYQANGDCKTAAEVAADFESLSEYSLVRMYGVDCDQLNTIGAAATALGMKLMLGVYYLDTLTTEIAEIVSYADGNWDNIETISIGNELINSGDATVAEVVAAIDTARTLLTAAGYTGNVVTVDTYAAVLNNPELCEASDFAAINAHAFFDPDTTAAEAGTWVTSIVAEVKAACGKTVVVTESGWPSQGETNGVAVPSSADQTTAIAALKSSFSSNPAGIVLFNAYNDLWKTNFDGSFDAEQYWGIYGTSSN